MICPALFSTKAVFILLLILTLRPGWAVEISDPARQFSFILPDGYIDNPMATIHPPIVRALYLPSTTENPLDGTFVSIQDMNGLLGQEELSNDSLPPGASVIKTKWKDYDIHVFRSYLKLNGTPVVQYSAQLPLLPHAIQLTFISASTHEDAVADLARSTVATVDGSSNWPKPGWQFEALVKIAAGLAVLLVLFLIGLALWRRFGPEGRETRGFSHAAKWF